MNTIRIILPTLLAIVLSSPTSADMLDGAVSGQGCIINPAALEFHNQNNQHVLSTQLDASQSGIQEKLITLSYDLELPANCDINAALTMNNFELLDQSENIQLEDVRFASGLRTEQLDAGAVGDLQLILEYTVTQTSDKGGELSVLMDHTLAL